MLEPLRPDEVPIGRVSELCDELKNLGNRQGTLSGYSFLDSMLPEVDAEAEVSALRQRIADYSRKAAMGLLTPEAVESLTMERWNACAEGLLARVRASELGSHRDVVDSRYRGSYLNLLYLVAMRGFVSFDPEFMVPISSSLRLGYSEIEGGVLASIRKELIIKSLGTWIGGYLNRRLVEFLRSAMVSEEDCGTRRGYPIYLSSRADWRKAYGRHLAEEASIGGLRLPAGTRLSYAQAGGLAEAGARVVLRSPITCEAHEGVCSRCFGYDVMNARPIEVGTPVGILAAHAISEPVTQLLMKTKHAKGLRVSSAKAWGQVRAGAPGRLVLVDARVVPSPEGSEVNLSASARGKVGEWSFNLPHGAVMVAREGAELAQGQEIFRYPLEPELRAEGAGRVRLAEGHLGRELAVEGPDGAPLQRALLGAGSRLEVTEGQEVAEGQLLCATASRPSVEEISDNFSKISLMLEGKPTGDFNFYAPAEGRLGVSEGSLHFISDQGYVDLGCYQPHAVVVRGRYAKGDLVAMGPRGSGARRLLALGEAEHAVEVMMGALGEIYAQESLEVSQVHLELFMAEFFLYVEGKGGERLHLARARRLGLEYQPLERSIKEPHIRDEVLNIISYEDAVRNIVKFSFTAMVDPLTSINSSLIAGKMVPVGSAYRRLHGHDQAGS